MINQDASGGLFSVPVANIKSNFTGSDGKPVLGLFVAHDVSVSNKLLINQKLEDQLLSEQEPAPEISPEEDERVFHDELDESLKTDVK